MLISVTGLWYSHAVGSQINEEIDLIEMDSRVKRE